LGIYRHPGDAFWETGMESHEAGYVAARTSSVSGYHPVNPEHGVPVFQFA
jgi:hypothetical protein